MTELDAQLARRKLATITRNLDLLAAVEGLTSLTTAPGLRNRLVHEYDAVNDAIVLEAVRQARRDFTAYVAAIEQYVTARGR